MSLIQFWRILWARKLLILGTTICCLMGGALVILTVPPRWTAEAHVFLNTLKPDPVTGLMPPESRSYISTQVELITDYSVAGGAVDRLGWLSDPRFIQQYQNRSRNDSRDFRHWLAEIISERTKAQIEDASNILNISYTTSDPESAKVVADALMQSYLDTSLAFRRLDANKNADWFALQAQKARASLDSAEAAVTKFERENGVVLTQDNKTDVESARLSSMAAQGSGGEATGGASLDVQLAELDAAIRNAAATLGPNNPEMLALKAKRDAYAGLNARGATSGRPGAGGSRIDAQKALVISEREKLSKLKSLQAEVDIRRDLYNKSSQKEVDFRQQAAVTDAGLTLLGNATVPAAPSFPKKTLIIGGCFGLGLVFGVLLALLTELLNRRVRGVEDLLSALKLPVLAVLAAPH